MNRRGIRNVLIGVAALVVLVAALFVIVDRVVLRRLSDLAILHNYCPPDEPGTVEAYAYLKLPSNVDDLWSSCRVSESWTIALRFTMNPEEVDYFLASTLVEADDTGAPKAMLTFDEDDIGGIESYLYGHYEEIGFLQQVLIDTSDPTRYTVYVNVVSAGSPLEQP